MQLYVTGIHTNTGKTHFSAAFCEAFKYDYFKLIQAGIPTDSEFIAEFSPKTHIFKAGFFLQTPASPHLAKKLEKVDYQGLHIRLPQSKNLLIEIAGGLFSPIDESHTMIDYINNFKYPCILVAKYYLGSINHILLSLEALKTRKIPIIALVIMGERDERLDEFISSYTKIKILNLPFYNKKDFQEKTQKLKESMSGLIETP